MSDNSSVTIYVKYKGKPGDWFDRSYYVDRHLPLVMEKWARYGLESVAAFFPAVEAVGTLTICECRFHDDAAVEAAFGSQEALEVMADVSRFTGLTPSRLRAVSL